MQILLAYGVVDSTDSPLYKTSKAFNRVRVDVAYHVDALCVIDAAMLISIDLFKPVISRELVGIDDGIRKHILFGDPMQSCLRHIS